MDIEKLKTVVLEEAKERENLAGQSGSHDDGGASLLKMQVKYYELGQRGITPDNWKTFEYKADPEYKEFLRLQKKFG